jgi:VWFA-related protein
VIRDAQGRAVGNLNKEDFQLFDNRKPQVISQFTVEQPGTQVVREQKTTEIQTGENAPNRIPSVAERFIVYLFDDVHLQTRDLLPIRDAAVRALGFLQPYDRAAIFTTSGQGNLDFTDDRVQLRAAVLGIQPRPLFSAPSRPCPYVNYYLADRISNKHDPDALLAVAKAAFHCSTGLDPDSPSGAPQFKAQIDRWRQMAESASMSELSIGDGESRLALGALKDAIRRLSASPGPRSIVLVSPGFLTPMLEYDLTDVIDKALHAGVIVGTLDARGLYVPMIGGDASGENAPDMLGAPEEGLYAIDAASANDGVLATLADATGGSFFHNNNDLSEGLRQISAAPESSYLLGFSPQNLKYDGSFHTLNVKLTNCAACTIRARKGYFAPKQAPNADEEVKQQILEALFSEVEMHDLPIDLHTQFFKVTDLDAKLSVLVHIDVKRLHFRKAEGRNNNNLTVVTGVFDRNGSLVTGNQKILEMRWKDETLEHKLDRGVIVKTSFDVKPGSYLVRLVVRDTEGMLTEENGAIEIP